MPVAHKFALVVLSVCFAIGGLVHLSDIVRGGMLPYYLAPLPINVYWTSLAVLDLFAVWLLWRHQRLGLAVALAIMVSDVGINSYVVYVLKTTFSFAPLQLQTLFLGFVLGCIGFLWPNMRAFSTSDSTSRSTQDVALTRVSRGSPEN
jgi:membrane protein HdeD